MKSHSDIAIIGTGFGGAVMAARLGAWAETHTKPVSIQVFERGEDHTGAFDPEAGDPGGEPLNAQGNRFRHTLSPDYLARVADVVTDADGAATDGAPTMNVLSGRGIGGGSNVYAGVSLRAPTVAFDQQVAGRRLWPARYSRAALDPWYAIVEQRLRVRRLAWTDAATPHWQLATRRDFVFAEGCRRIGATAVPLKLAADADTNDGWWSQGERFPGRQNLTGNYLAGARDAGVLFCAGCEVETIAPTDDGYVLRGTDRRRTVSHPFEVTCRVLVVAAGAVASTGLLLRSADDFAGARALDQGAELIGRPALGRHLSANGDYGVTGIVGDDFELDVEAHKSKPIGSVCPSFFKDHGFLILPFYAEPLYLALGRISTLLRAQKPAAVGRRSTDVAMDAAGRPERDWGPEYKARLARFGSRMLSMGCLALDASEGEVRLGTNGALQVRWQQTDPATEDRWDLAVDTMRRIYEALGGEMYLDNYRKDGTVNTSHPLGGCRMADDPTEGVVDPFGESFANANLFVVDGGIIPSSLAANPSLTIAAVAESIADALIMGDGTLSLADRLA